MKNTVSYFRHHFLRQLPYLLIVSGVSALFALIPMFDSDKIGQYSSPELYYAIVPLGFLTVITPVVELWMFKKRRNLDNLFSLPIERVEMLGVHWLNGILTNWIAFSVAVLITAVRLAAYPEYFDLFYLFPLWLVGLLWSLLLFGFFAFLFYEGNTAMDGAFFVLSHTYLGFFVVSDFYLVADLFDAVDLYDLGYISPFEPISYIESCCTFLMRVSYQRENVFEYFMSDSVLYSTVVYLVLSAAATIAFFLWSSRKRVEKVGEVSDSWFGYRTILPIVLMTLLAFAAELTMVFLVLMLALAIGGYCLYRRGFRLKISDWIVLAVLFLFSVIFYL